jgi:hypothetical protein
VREVVESAWSRTGRWIVGGRLGRAGAGATWLYFVIMGMIGEGDVVGVRPFRQESSFCSRKAARVIWSCFLPRAGTVVAGLRFVISSWN